MILHKSSEKNHSDKITIIFIENCDISMVRGDDVILYYKYYKYTLKLQKPCCKFMILFTSLLLKEKQH